MPVNVLRSLSAYFGTAFFLQALLIAARGNVGTNFLILLVGGMLGGLAWWAYKTNPQLSLPPLRLIAIIIIAGLVAAHADVLFWIMKSVWDVFTK